MNPAGQVEIHTAKNFFSNIDSRTVLDFDFQHGSSFRRETDALIFTLSRGLESTNRRFVLRRTDHFPHGVVSTIFQSAISLRDCDTQETHAFQASASLSSSGVGRQARLTFLTLARISTGELKNEFSLEPV
jgi:hypothetical protein